MANFFGKNRTKSQGGISDSGRSRRLGFLALVAVLGLLATVANRVYRYFTPPVVYGLPEPARRITAVDVSYLDYRARVGPEVEPPACLQAMVGALDLASASGLRAWATKLTGVGPVYLPGTDTIFVPVGRNATPLVDLAHERAHGVQDQFVNLDSLLSARTTTDSRLAAKAILEGVAVLASDTLAGHEEAVYTDDILSNWDKATYVQGAAFVRDQRDRSGRSLVEITSAPPISTWSLLFPGEELPATLRQPSAPELDGDAVLTCDGDELGPLALYTAALRYTNSYQVAARVAFAWRGDRVTIYELHGQTYARWAVNFAPGAVNIAARWSEWYPAVPEAIDDGLTTPDTAAQ